MKIWKVISHSITWLHWLIGWFGLVGVCTGLQLRAECRENHSFDKPWIVWLAWFGLVGFGLISLVDVLQSAGRRSYLRHALSHLAPIARSGTLCQVLKEQKQYFLEPLYSNAIFEYILEHSLITYFIIGTVGYIC